MSIQLLGQSGQQCSKHKLKGKNKMKKIISIILAVMLTLSIGIMAFADNGISGDNDIEVSYTTTESYTVTIPSDQTVSTTAQTGTVSASGVLLADGNRLVVSMASANGYKMKYEGSEIAYTASVGEKTLSGTAAEEVLSVNSGSTSGSQNISFVTTSEAIAAATKAGKHTDTLTFTCGVENRECRRL